MNARMNDKETIKWIAKKAKAERGWNIWIVGGPVRDHMMGRANHDIDCIIEGANSADEINDFMSEFADSTGIHGARFGVCKAKVNGHEFDFVPPRRENKIGEGKAGFKMDFNNVSMEEDMRRRDFKFNAAAMNVMNGEIFDPFGAAEAIARREISPVSDAFCEDSNRMRRGARFAARFDFAANDEMKEMADRVRDEFESESSDVIWAEFQKWASDKNAKAGNFWRFFKDCRFEEFFPEISDWDTIAAECDKIKWDCNMDEFEGDKNAKRRENERRCIAMFAAMKRAGTDAEKMARRFGRSNSFIRKMNNFDKPEPPFKGSEIIAMFPNKKPGAWIKEIERAIAGMNKAEAEAHINENF